MLKDYTMPKCVFVKVSLNDNILILIKSLCNMSVSGSIEWRSKSGATMCCYNMRSTNLKIYFEVSQLNY